MNRKALLGKALLEVVAEFAVFATLLFVAAGTLLWPARWVSMALFFGLSRPGGEAAKAEGTERGNYRPLPVRQAPYVYSSMFLFFPALALLLGSWWGLLLCPGLLGLVVWRTTLEDGMLENGLAGYQDYERNVRYRLIPRVW